MLRADRGWEGVCYVNPGDGKVLCQGSTGTALKQRMRRAGVVLAKSNMPSTVRMVDTAVISHLLRCQRRRRAAKSILRCIECRLVRPMSVVDRHGTGASNSLMKHKLLGSWKPEGNAKVKGDMFSSTPGCGCSGALEA